MFAIIFTAQAVGQASTWAPNISKAKLAALSIFEILDRTSRINYTSDKGQKVDHFQGSSKLQEVGFFYPNRSDAQILKGLNVDVTPGYTVALVGPSGCGKSTVIALLERWYDPCSGSVQVENIETRDWHLSSLRQNMSLVGQEPVLFNLSIAENIAYGAKDGKATQEEIIAASKAANLHDFVESLPLKYETTVGEKGAQLSGGQKVKLFMILI